MTAALQRYKDGLRPFPRSGGGGAHAALLANANRGVRAGLTDEQIFEDLRARVHGTRRVPDREIRDAIRKARQAAPTGPRPRWTPPAAPAPKFDANAVCRHFIESGAAFDEYDVWECSPCRMTCASADDARILLATLYAPDEFVFIGDRYDATSANVRTVLGWLAAADTLTRFPHIIPNPLTGQPAPKKDGTGQTFRGDACVSAHRYAVLEFDTIPRTEQIAFFCGVDWPIAALIDSGGKSVHAWLRVDTDAAGWTRDVRPLFRDRLAPMGLDGACANPARLSRLPGHHRAERDRWQRILFLDPAARGPRHYLLKEIS